MTIETFLLYSLLLVLYIILTFGVSLLACSFALGRMHVWLKGKAEVFGDNEGLREELSDIRGHVIGQANDQIFNRNIGSR